MKRSLYLSILALVITTGIAVLSNGCKKETETITVNGPCIPAPVCDVRGTYNGTGTASTGGVTTLSYILKDNNFAVGSLTSSSPAVTFGGYKNTCDSVNMSVFYTGNSSYYLFLGKLSTSGATTTISGTFKNLTIPAEFGTFILTK